ncbi:hypothetical protein [Micromonospora sp. DT47]|uniref:hypothetical protein n=1 Tax=Micromonospora sp. DT47 TaxID=3393431 RepID=UPI003CFA1C71
MPTVATTRPIWAATLRVMRDLTRLAVTTLVLGAAVAGTTGPSAAASAPVRPSVVASRVAELPATARPTDAPAADTSPRPLPARRAAASAHPAPLAPAATTDPVRDATGRRGPPRH